MIVRDENLNHLRVIVVRGMHERGPAVLVFDALLFLKKRFDRINVSLLGRVHEGRHPLSIALAGTDFRFKQHPDGPSVSVRSRVHEGRPGRIPCGLRSCLDTHFTRTVCYPFSPPKKEAKTPVIQTILYSSVK
ncbi:Hypothetical protein GLP15_1677 [Giardia lamblia P15]|uniref:Uncharacterized protein n=1 Tax=Giardia intestinalis (strain P15) TaxID=658858 RepID=E1F4S6_GIAIA|nr:Hypothetical protein GLP15_1677 [Giardia lamblia P15]